MLNNNNKVYSFIALIALNIWLLGFITYIFEKEFLVRISTTEKYIVLGLFGQIRIRWLDISDVRINNNYIKIFTQNEKVKTIKIIDFSKNKDSYLQLLKSINEKSGIIVNKDELNEYSNNNNISASKRAPIMLTIVLLLAPISVRKLIENSVNLELIVMVSVSISITIGLFLLLFKINNIKLIKLAVAVYSLSYFISWVLIAYNRGLQELNVIIGYNYSELIIILIYILIICLIGFTSKYYLLYKLDYAKNKNNASSEFSTNMIKINVNKVIRILAFVFVVFVLYKLCDWYNFIDREIYSSIEDVKSSVYKDNETMVVGMGDYIYFFTSDTQKQQEYLYFKQRNGEIVRVNDFHKSTKEAKFSSKYLFDDDILLLITIYNHENNFIILLNTKPRYNDIKVYDNYNYISKVEFVDEEVYFYYLIKEEEICSDYKLIIKVSEDDIYTINGSEFSKSTPEIVKEQ